MTDEDARFIREVALQAAVDLSKSRGDHYEIVLQAAKGMEAYLKGDAAPEPKCFTQPDPTFKNEVLNDVDA